MDTIQKFRAVIELHGKTATGIVVPPEAVAALGAGRKPKVIASVQGFRYRTSVAFMGGEYLLPVSGEIREKAGVAAGDEVEVELEVDTEAREVCLPPDFVAALDAEPRARERFIRLSFSKKSGFVIPIEGAKTPETRERRIQKAISDLNQLDPT